jgi:hypothetical protein
MPQIFAAEGGVVAKFDQLAVVNVSQPSTILKFVELKVSKVFISTVVLPVASGIVSPSLMEVAAAPTIEVSQKTCVELLIKEVPAIPPSAPEPTL